MSFWSSLVKVVTGVAAVIAAPFTFGASLLALPLALKAEDVLFGNGKTTNPLKNASPTGSPNELQRVLMKPSATNPPPLNYKGENPVYNARKSSPIEKTDVTLYGYYNDINKLTIPVDNDERNIVIVPNTYFTYIVTFSNHPPSEGVRYISQFVYEKIKYDWETNLGKVLYNIEPQLSVYPYINFDWQTFVDKFNNIEADRLKKDGGIMFGFSIDPIFLLQWQDGPEVTNLLDYSWYIPPPVKTVKDPKPVDNSGQALRKGGEVSVDPKREDRFARLLGIASQATIAFGVAKAALGGIKSIYGNTKSSIKNLQDTAAQVGDKFNSLKTSLSKDAINGKITQVKNLIKTKLPTPKNIKKLFMDVKGDIIAQLDPLRKQRLERKKQKREAKDKKKATKFSLKNFSLPDLPKVPNLPSIPKLPTQLNAGSLTSLSSGLGSLPNISGLISTAKGVVNGIGNINFSDPMSLLNAPANILNQAASLGEAATDVMATAEKTITQPTLDAKNAREKQMQQYEAELTKLRTDALATLAKPQGMSLVQLPKPVTPKNSLMQADIVKSKIPNTTTDSFGSIG
jgi:hypothetical protein